MAGNQTILTQKGYEKFKAELEDCLVVKRTEIAERLKEARAQGDLSENAEFDAAKDEQGQNEDRINELKLLLEEAKVAPTPTDCETVQIGHKVTILEEDEDEEEEYELVGPKEAKSMDNIIGIDSPFAEAMLGHHAGDEISYPTPAGGTFTFTITKIEIA